MENKKSSQEYCCLLVLDNSNNNYYICFKCRIHFTNKPKVEWDKLSRIGTAIIITLLTSLTPMNQEKLDTQTQTIQIIENYATITRLILEFYRK